MTQQDLCDSDAHDV